MGPAGSGSAQGSEGGGGSAEERPRSGGSAGGRPAASRFGWFRLVFFTLYLPGILIFGGMVLLRWRMGIPMGEFTRDAINLVKFPAHYGAVANLGVLFWAVAATAAFLGASLLRGRSAQAGSRRYLISSGVITAFLLFDDLYNLHDVVYPFSLGLPEHLVYAVYVAAMVWYLAAWRRRLMASRQFTLFLVAGGALGASLGIDVLLDRNMLTMQAQYLVEDGLKYVGMASWAAFYVRESFDVLREIQKIPANP